MVFFLVVVALFVFIVVPGVIWVTNVPKKPKAIDGPDLTLLSKEQYDFLRSNGMTVTQNEHDFFYPPVHVPAIDMDGRDWGGKTHVPVDKWGEDAEAFVKGLNPPKARRRRPLRGGGPGSKWSGIFLP